MDLPVARREQRYLTTIHLATRARSDGRIMRATIIASAIKISPSSRFRACQWFHIDRGRYSRSDDGPTDCDHPVRVARARGE